MRPEQNKQQMNNNYERGYRSGITPYVQSASAMLSAILQAKAAREKQRRDIRARAFEQQGTGQQSGYQNMSGAVGSNFQTQAAILKSMLG